jgi:hypothetical protein
MSQKSTRNTSNGKSREAPLDDSGLSRQQVLELGQMASEALNNPIYNVAHQMIVGELIESWAATSPKETNRRESLWHEIQAAGKLAQRMAQMVERAKELLQRQGAEQQQEENEYLDRQGFGFGEQYSGGPENFQ